MYAIATLANEHALEDLQLLLFTLELWNNPPPSVYIFTDTETKPKIDAIPYKGKKITKIALDPYTGLNRSVMERTPGTKFATLFADFCAEKPVLMKWVLESESAVLFCDADICHLGPLPSIDERVNLAVSPHLIRKSDTDRFGLYNAGYLYLKNQATADQWLQLCKTSRFFEQGCLEDLVSWSNIKYGVGSVEQFPETVNYGWWRLWQGDCNPEALMKKWRILRKEGGCGLIIGDKPLQSIHTHWSEQRDMATAQFNFWILKQLQALSSVKKTRHLTTFLETQHPHLKKIQ